LILLTPPAVVIICNLKSTEANNAKTPPHIFLPGQAAIPIIIQKLPYDKAATPVKRIDAFQIGDPGRRAVLFDPYKLMRYCPKLLQHYYRGSSLKEPASPFGNQAEIIKAGPATIPEQFASGPDPGDTGRKSRDSFVSLNPGKSLPVSVHQFPNYLWELR